MSRQGASQLLRRVIAALLFIAAAIAIGSDPPLSGALAVAGGVIYGVWPKPATKTGDLTLRHGPAVFGPDVLGFSLTALFAAMPIWIGRGEATPGLHGSASMIWIMAAGSSFLLLVGATANCFRLRIDEDGLLLTRLSGKTRLLWPEIRGWKPWRRGLPVVVRKLVPFTPPGAAGAILLARDSTGIEVHLKDGRTYRLPREGFEHGHKQLLHALVANGVPRMSEGPKE